MCACTRLLLLNSKVWQKLANVYTVMFPVDFRNEKERETKPHKKNSAKEKLLDTKIKAETSTKGDSDKDEDGPSLLKPIIKTFGVAFLKVWTRFQRLLKYVIICVI